MDLLVLLDEAAYSLALGGFGISRIMGEPMSADTIADRRAAAAEAARRLISR
jgi:hypothetical protein